MNDYSYRSQRSGAHTNAELRLPYLPGLDGLRAVSVIAVLFYHAGLPVWGGYLGVEAFFVLSGFLITALLLVEWNTHRRINLRAFWSRRFRRLLPAVLVLIAGSGVIAWLILPSGETPDQGRDMLAALGYMMNWNLILGEQSYFDPTLRPPLLQHLWSLAIEEQFYLAWPLLVIAWIRLMGLRGLLLFSVISAFASWLLMAAMYTPGTDPSRVYFGTDTRAGGLLLGAALAIVWTPGSVPAAQNRRLGGLLDLLGIGALIGLGYAFINLFAQDPRLYQGGFMLVGLATALVIMAIAHPQARIVPGLLGFAPLRWIGTRSYSLYLWHWPIFQITRPGMDVNLGGWQLFALRFGITLVLAELSYRFVEQPVRQGALNRLWNTLRNRRTTPQPEQVPVPELALVTHTPARKPLHFEPTHPSAVRERDRQIDGLVTGSGD
jgi:peptidoglycan/LPS O-acetylase OafA/YrhL